MPTFLTRSGLLTQEEYETERDILIHWLERDKANLLEGLDEKGRNHLMNKWASEVLSMGGTDAYEKWKNKDVGGKPDRGIDVVPALNDKARGVFINAVGNKCENPECKSPYILEVHHITKRLKGGTNKLHNLIVLCPNCHKLAETGTYRKAQLGAWSRPQNRKRFSHWIDWKY